MAKKERSSPAFIAFLAAMILLMALGVLLLVYGSMHNTVPVPHLPGSGPFALAPPHV